MTRYFTKDHEWIDVDGGAGTVGITDYAQSQLGDITFVELPAVGASFGAGDAAAVVESVKAASDIYAPAAGTVTEVNPALDAEPDLVNTQAESGGWLFRVTLADAGAVAGLMDQAAYDAYVKEL
jgi:glycine cleavage system H protein